MTDQELNEAVARKLNAVPSSAFLPTLPDYCHSIEAAWEILASLAAQARCVQLNMDGKETGCWIGTAHCKLAFASASTAPRAIALAFLKLEGVK